MAAAPARSPSIGAEAKDSEADAKMTLSARQGAARAVSKGGQRGSSGCATD